MRQIEALVIGAGPAGLAAADVLSGAGHPVVICDRMPSPARKFLMAGKSGLNLTWDGTAQDHVAASGEALRPMLEAFGAEDVVRWAEGLGQPMFTGSTGRVFPVAMKASPLLRAWLARLEARGVTLERRWRWTGFEDAASVFETPGGAVHVEAKVTVLAMGGASWARLGSDGAWTQALRNVAPFQPANMGFRVDWSPHIARVFGQPVKGVAWRAEDQVSRGEVIVSKTGLEGGGIYALSRALREGAALHVDLKPDWPEGEVARRLVRRGKETWSAVLRKGLRLDPVKAALMREFGGPPEGWSAALVKDLPVRLAGPAPMDEAISVAGGVRFEALDDRLMLTARPGVFCAGEMLDWEAPTGGYLLTGCLATGRWAGASATEWLRARSGTS